jgi:hypothetical protein
VISTYALSVLNIRNLEENLSPLTPFGESQRQLPFDPGLPPIAGDFRTISEPLGWIPRLFRVLHRHVGSRHRHSHVVNPLR